MASQIDTVRKLHAPSLTKVPDTYDVDVICEHCTDLIRSAVQKIDPELAAKTPNVEYPCDTALSAGTTEAAARAEVEKVRGDYFDDREAVLREELEYIETVRALTTDADAEDEKDDEPEPEAEKEPEKEAPAKKAPAKRAPAKRAPAKKAEPKPEPKPEPEPADEDAPAEPAADEDAPADEDNDWDF